MILSWCERETGVCVCVCACVCVWEKDTLRVCHHQMCASVGEGWEKDKLRVWMCVWGGADDLVYVYVCMCVQM